MFMTIRTYAISGYNWWTTTSVFVLCAMPVGMSAYGYFAHRHFELVKLPIIGDTCLDTSDISAGFMLTAIDVGTLLLANQQASDCQLVEIITRISFLLPDIVVLLLTVVKTHAARRESKHHSMIAPFSALLLHNGKWMMKLHIANAVAFAFSRRWASTFFIASTFLNPGMAIAISRFHLTLRRMAYELDDTGDPRLLSFSRIRDPEDAASHLSGPIFYDPGMAEEWSDTESDNVQLDNVPLNPEERGKLYIDADDGGRDLKRTRHEDEPVI
ncbi:hypothetical protein CERSUDRAFT_119343 [Gelatoporia subvermispora B]|uniref:Uncharacterized protein n=1 Tax=Ceriporiopsis subvermispora (strain B) TaxID=914234 RepID=M2QYZ6_CERS8|nr:hypothetical protein CERSUDRAFT_119343 [Gelatoporia subvermispora B]